MLTFKDSASLIDKNEQAGEDDIMMLGVKNIDKKVWWNWQISLLEIFVGDYWEYLVKSTYLFSLPKKWNEVLC